MTPFARRLGAALVPHNHDSIAAAAGLHPRRLQRLANARTSRGPMVAEVEDLARALRCSPAWLAFGVRS